MNRWTPSRKAAVVLELLRGGDAVELARRHGLSQAQLFVWRDIGSCKPAKLPSGPARGQAEQEQDRQVRELERKVGQLTLENEILKTDELIRQRGRRSIR